MQFQGIQLFKVGQDRRRGQLGKQRVMNAVALFFLLCFQAKAPSLRNGVATTVFSLNPQRHAQRLVSIVTLNP